MKRRILILLLACLFLLFFKSAEASLLWLYAEPSIYISNNSDAWLRDSWLTGSEDFDLSVLNRYKKRSVYDVNLVIAISEETKEDGLTISLNGDTFNEDDFDSSGKHPYIKKHGVFGTHTYFMDYSIGDLFAKDIYDLGVSIQSDSGLALVHFDAYGTLVNKRGRSKIITNPYSHDVTWKPQEYHEPIPEPATFSLLGLGLLGLLARYKATGRGNNKIRKRGGEK